MLDSAEHQITVTVPHSRRVEAPRGVLLRRLHVPAGARTHREELPVTSRSWTVLDLLATVRYGEAVRLADRAIQRGWLTQAELAARPFEHPCRTGNRQLRRLAHLVTDGAAAESERVLHRLLRRAGVRGWVANHPVWAWGELVAVIDVAIPERRIAIEIDGMAYHVDTDRFQRDRSRQNALTALGWTVLRFTWADLLNRPGYVAATITRVAA